MRCSLKKLVPANRTLKKLLSEIEFKCNNEDHGCKEIIPYDKVPSHLADC